VRSQLEPCTAQLRRLISFAAGSDSRLLRAALVRLCGRAAGLGGGMGPFLAAPLVEELTGSYRAAEKGLRPWAECRRVLEVLAPLAAKPAMKVGQAPRGRGLQGSGGGGGWGGGLGALLAGRRRS
jgi:hypothetical protein